MDDMFENDGDWMDVNDGGWSMDDGESTSSEDDVEWEETRNAQGMN
jgi:predicted NUDIX family NTP pyrophosphohydrolase